jgi:C-terminal processing protease CtpA/Prc
MLCCAPAPEPVPEVVPEPPPMMPAKGQSCLDIINAKSANRVTLPVPPGPIGVVFAKAGDGTFKITRVKDDSPLAGQVGPGDKIISVDGEDTNGHTFQQIADHLKDKQASQRVLVISKA